MRMDHQSESWTTYTEVRTHARTSNASKTADLSIDNIAGSAPELALLRY